MARAHSREKFAQRYGSWAVVAGASEGLGEAFARALAARGLNVLLIARRAALLDELATSIRSESSVEVRTLALDLSGRDLAERLIGAFDGLEVGMAVYNAAFAPVGNFVDLSLDDLQRVVDVNVRGPVVFAHVLTPAMLGRGRGGLILMSSLAGMQGTPRLAAYAASKAFNTVLAEGLWGELRASGVDVLACCAGAVRTPGYNRSAGKEAPGTLAPEDVVERTLSQLAAGPGIVPGLVNRIASVALGRVLPRRTAVSIMASNTRNLT